MASGIAALVETLREIASTIEEEAPVIEKALDSLRELTCCVKLGVEIPAEAKRRAYDIIDKLDGK